MWRVWFSVLLVLRLKLSSHRGIFAFVQLVFRQLCFFRRTVSGMVFACVFLSGSPGLVRRLVMVLCVACVAVGLWFHAIYACVVPVGGFCSAGACGAVGWGICFGGALFAVGLLRLGGSYGCLRGVLSGWLIVGVEVGCGRAGRVGGCRGRLWVVVLVVAGGVGL